MFQYEKVAAKFAASFAGFMRVADPHSPTGVSTWDKKPSDWVDEAKIADPEAKKPDDWNEDAPEYIPDEDAKKPEDWNDNEPEQIADPDATKPEDWDDEEDGEWVAPTIREFLLVFFYFSIY
jgi:hypothetical protein